MGQSSSVVFFRVSLVLRVFSPPTLFILGLALVLVQAPRAAGDTIFLKNGRRIVALSVVEEGDRVKYQTAAGELSLPNSIVDHIERGGAMPMGNSPGGAASLAMTPPAIDQNTPIEVGAVHDGGIDRQYLARVDGEARSGSAEKNEIAALAHHTAAQFELTRGDMEHALADERSALIYAPENPVILMNVAYLHLRRSEYRVSLDYLERAQRVAPDNPDVAKLSGWAYYGMNKLDQAVAEWERALAIRPDPEVQRALYKAQRDRQEEESYRENESSHFTLRYSGGSEPELAREILRTLETHFSAIESELNFTPPDPIGVILYTQQAFADITRVPAWVGALNDGRIRVPVQGLKNLTPELSRVLKHELTHSFIQQKTHGRAPTWVQEGLAQWMEGKRSSESASLLVQIYDQRLAMRLGELESSWMGLSGDVAAYAYAWALANIEFIVGADGMGDVERILNKIGAGEPTESAVREVLHNDYDELMKSTAEYLRKNYMR